MEQLQERDEIYLSDRWCLTGGPSESWDRIEVRERVSSLASGFLGSVDAVLDFLLNTNDPNNGYIKQPFEELREKLEGLRGKANRDGNQAVSQHCAGLEKQCSELLERSAKGIRAFLRVDATSMPENSIGLVAKGARDEAYGWLDMWTQTPIPADKQAAEQPHSVVQTTAPGPDLSTPETRKAAVGEWTKRWSTAMRVCVGADLTETAYGTKDGPFLNQYVNGMTRLKNTESNDRIKTIEKVLRDDVPPGWHPAARK